MFETLKLVLGFLILFFTGIWRVPLVFSFWSLRLSQASKIEKNCALRKFVWKLVCKVLMDDYPTLVCLALASLTLYKIPKVIRLVWTTFKEDLLRTKTSQDPEPTTNLKRSWSLANETLAEGEALLFLFVLLVTVTHLPSTLRRLLRFIKNKRKLKLKQKQEEMATQKYGKSKSLVNEAVKEQEFSFIADFLEPKDIYMLGRTCKQFHEYSKADYIWEEVEKNFIRTNKELRGIGVPHEDMSPYQKAIKVFNISHRSKCKGITEEEKDLLFGYKYCIIEEYTLLLIEATSLIVEGEKLFGKLLIKIIPMKFFFGFPLFNQQWHSSRLTSEEQYFHLYFTKAVEDYIKKEVGMAENKTKTDKFYLLAPFLVFLRLLFVIINFIHELYYIPVYYGRYFLILPKREFPPEQHWESIKYEFRYSIGHGLYSLFNFASFSILMLAPFFYVSYWNSSFFAKMCYSVGISMNLILFPVILISFAETSYWRGIPNIQVDSFAIFRLLKLLYHDRTLEMIPFVSTITLPFRLISKAIELQREIMVKCGVFYRRSRICSIPFILPTIFVWIVWPFSLLVWVDSFYSKAFIYCWVFLQGIKARKLLLQGFLQG